MPLILFFLYIAVEAVAFYALASWIGLGWALLVLFALMILPGLMAMRQLRHISRRAATRKLGPGGVLGDIGLLFSGLVLGVIPGVVTAVLGLILIFGPTRSLVRKVMARSVTRKIESYGTRLYQQSPMAQRHTSYGSFIVDEDHS